MWRARVLGVGIVGAMLSASAIAAECRPGQWLLPGSGEPVAHSDVLQSVEPGTVLLLGEHHDNARHHRWQAGVISGLLAVDMPLNIGFESFPRRLQPVLDDWTAGNLDEETFQRDSEWARVWGFDWGLYLPLFELARLHGLPMHAINVERALVSRVGKEGWDAIPDDEREGLTDPASAPEAYAEYLREVRTAHASDDNKPDEAKINRFIQAQLTWDRAMAEALAQAQADQAVSIGIIGSGHLRFGHGVAHQLSDLGIERVQTWLPIDPEDCADLVPGFADAVFVIDEPPRQEPEPRPRLGISVEAAEGGGLRVGEVAEESIAEATGLRTGDILYTAAGRQMDTVADLVAVVSAQPLGTWLPLLLRRDEVPLRLLAQFPDP